MVQVVESRKMDTATSRQRMLAALHGQKVDRFPVWLKMANSTWKRSQPEPYRSMPDVELLKAVGCDLMLSSSIDLVSRAPHVTRTSEKNGAVCTTRIETPDGPLVSESRIDPLTLTTHPTSYLVETPDELRKLRWLFRDTSYRVAPDSILEAAARQGQHVSMGAVSCAYLPPSPLMDVVQHLCGPAATFCLLMDEPALFREVMGLMHEDRVRMIRARLPYECADTVWMVENTSTTLISPKLFKTYCMPYLAEYGNLILEHDKIPVHHMCGCLNKLLEMIDTLPAMANEAFTTPPLGNTTLMEGRTRMSTKTLIGGTNATLWLEPVERIVEAVAQDLSACPDRRRIFLTSAGVLPPAVSFQKAKAVVDAFKEL